MSLGLYDILVPTLRRSFIVLGRLVDEAERHFEASGIDAATIVALRLAPDMKPFPFQVEAAINNGLGAIARLAGEPPSPIEGLRTFSEMRIALAATLHALEAVTPEALVGAEAREIVLPNAKGARRFAAADYLLMLVLPNVHFHTSIAYALLRTTGLEIGKRDFLGDLPPRETPPAVACGRS